MNAREFAYEALVEIMLEESYSNLYLRSNLSKVEQNERGLATQLVYGTLQNARYVRHIWEAFASKLPSKNIRVLLDMSVYELEFLSTPDYAVLTEAVNLTKKIDMRSSKFVNAILRSVTRREVEVFDDSLESVALKTSHPEWLVKMWAKQYGNDIAAKICESNLEEKPLSVRVDTSKVSLQELCSTGNYTKGELSPICLHYVGDHLFSEQEFLDGSVIVQDEASQMVAFALDVGEGMNVFDACSAPGTKTSQIAQMMKDSGNIQAMDLHEHRVELILQLAKKLSLTSIHASVGDARSTNYKNDSFDRVLCDVPCSGYGVLSRKSDIKYHMQSSDMDGLLPIQYDILTEGIRVLKPEGILVYSTCTLNKKENEKQVEKALQAHPNMTLVKEETLFPFTYHSDGFYIAVLRKNS